MSPSHRFAGLGLALLLGACASQRPDVVTTATVVEEARPVVVDGIKPLTVEQAEQIEE